MGANCVVELPVDVTARRLADVVGVLAGLSVRLREETSFGRHSVFADVSGAEDRATSISGMADIVLTPEKGSFLAHGAEVHSGTFHFCCRDGVGCGKISNHFGPTSTPFWCAISKRLVRFFGGRVIYNDCEAYSGRNVYAAKRSCPVDKHGLVPDDGEAWNKYERAVVALKPVTEADIVAAQKVAGYKLDDEMCTMIARVRKVQALVKAGVI